MANENPSADITNEIVTAVLDTHIKPAIQDQLNLEIPFMNWMTQSPHNKSQNGGHRFRVGLRNKKTDGLVSFGQGATITPQRKPVLGHAWMTMKQALSYVMFEWIEERQNAGEGKVHDIIVERIAATLQDSKEDFQTMLWSDGTGNGAKDFMGITGLVPADPTSGVMMGYDRALTANAYWRNWFWDGSTFGPHPIDAEPAGATPSNVGAFGTFSAGTGGGVATSFKILETGFNSVAQGEQKGDLAWWSDQETYEYYSTGYKLYQHNLMIPSDPNISKFGFGGAMFRDVPWMWDTIENGAPANQLRLLNSRYIHLVKDSGGWMIWTDWREPFNQIARAKFFLVRGNFAISKPRKQAVFQGITDWVAA